MTNSLLIAAALGVLLFIVREATRDVVLFDQFSVPQAIEQQGYNGQAVSMMIADRVLAIRKLASSQLEQESLVTLADKAPDLEVPRVGITLETVVRFSRALFRDEPAHVGGSIVFDSSSVRLRVRIANSPVADTGYAEFRTVTGTRSLEANSTGERQAIAFPMPSDGMSMLVDSAAQAVLERTQPYLLAAYAYVKRDTARTRRLIAYVLEYAPASERPYAHNLLGSLLSDQGDETGALRQYKLAALAAPKLALPYHNMAYLYYTRGRYVEADRAVDSALVRAPHFSKSLNLRGLLFEIQHRYPEAERAFVEAAREDPSEELYVSNWADLLAEEGHDDDARLKYQEALARRPDDPSLHFGLGSSERQDLALAVSEFERGLSIVEARHPGGETALDIEGYERLARLLHEGGRDSAGAAVLRRAARRDSIHADPFIALGRYLFPSYRREAEDNFARAAAIDRSRGDVYVAWGQALHKEGDLRAALAKYRQGMSNAPSDARSFYYYASSLGDSAAKLSNDRFDAEAEKMWAASDGFYRKALQLDSTSIGARVNWSQDLAMHGRYAAADTLLQRAARDNPWNIAVIAFDAAILRRLGDYRGAGQQYARAFAFDSTSFSDLANWGFVLLHLGDFRGSAQRYEQASRRIRLNAYDHNNWGVALEKLGREAEAIAQYERAMADDPNLAEGFYNMALVMHRRGDYRRAAELLRRAIASDSTSLTAAAARGKLSTISRPAVN